MILLKFNKRLKEGQFVIFIKKLRGFENIDRRDLRQSIKDTAQLDKATKRIFDMNEKNFGANQGLNLLIGKLEGLNDDIFMLLKKVMSEVYREFQVTIAELKEVRKDMRA